MTLPSSEKNIKYALQCTQDAIKNLGTIIHTTDFKDAVGLLDMRKGKIIATGIGKSSFVAMKMAATFTSLGIYTVFLNPSDALHGDIGVISDGDILVSFSFSGETTELVKILRYAKKEFGIQTIAITGNENSTIAKRSDAQIAIKVKEEGDPLNLAPMASTTVSLVVSDLLAVALASRNSFEKSDFARYHPAGSLGLVLRKVADYMIPWKVAAFVSESASFFDAVQKIGESGAGVAIVLDGKRHVVGVFTDGDIRRTLLEHDGDVLHTKPINKLMTKHAKTIHKNDNLKKALSILEQNKITSLAVVDAKDKFVGILHMHSILEESLREKHVK